MPELQKPSEEFLNSLKELLGSTGWREGDDARYLEEPRGNFRGQAALIVLPANVEEVSEIVKRCSTARVGIIPYGGGTGLVSGQLSLENDHSIILSLERMNKIRNVDVKNDSMLVEAGCILADIQSAALDENRLFPLSLASEGSCRIGGNLATNAGGIQVIRYGNARDLCLGIEAVLPDGSIYHGLTPLRKDNTGYDLRHMMIGSEGTLGIITAASLKLFPNPQNTATAFCAIPSPSHAISLLKFCREEMGETISAFELMCAQGMKVLANHFPQEQDPFKGEYNWFTLIEIAGPSGIEEKFETMLMSAFENGFLLDSVIASSSAQSQALWRLRELMAEANKLEGAICSSDTSVPKSQVDQFIEETDAALLALHPGLRVNKYGHMGDGNLHFNVFPPEGIGKAQFLSTYPTIQKDVRLVIDKQTHQMNGSISGEHGIGRLKRNELQRYSDPAKLAVMKSIKAALDPHGIMNPGAVFSD
ncbi:MAG: FAD-binding oxidoreductase [Hyphomicrobiales bacterium]|nr:MAG: FAD-binding oxidoreductase [Hyphomicrobiales bacterium]